MVKGTLAWWEIDVPDSARAVEFYSDAFGWKFESFAEFPGVTFCRDDSGELVGALYQNEEPRSGKPPFRLYFATEDLEGVLAAVERAGGEVRRGRTLISENYGWYAEIADPLGTPIGLSTSNPAPAGAD